MNNLSEKTKSLQNDGLLLIKVFKLATPYRVTVLSMRVGMDNGNWISDLHEGQINSDNAMCPELWQKISDTEERVFLVEQVFREGDKFTENMKEKL